MSAYIETFLWVNSESIEIDMCLLFLQTNSQFQNNLLVLAASCNNQDISLHKKTSAHQIELELEAHKL